MGRLKLISPIAKTDYYIISRVIKTRLISVKQVDRLKACCHVLSVYFATLKVKVLRLLFTHSVNIV
jgi:hypothetical protein